MSNVNEVVDICTHLPVLWSAPNSNFVNPETTGTQMPHERRLQKFKPSLLDGEPSEQIHWPLKKVLIISLCPVAFILSLGD
jgi:hypothetical protein